MKKYNQPVTKKGWEENTIQYSKLWDSPFRKWLSEKETGYVLNSFKAYLKNSGKKLNEVAVLDVGSGAGRILDIYISKQKVKNVYSIDYAKNMVDFVKKRFGNKIVAKKADIAKEQIPYSENFDFISSIRVIKYTSSWKKAIANVSKNLKDNGYFLFTLPNKNSITYFSNDKWHKASLSEIRDVLKRNNMEIIDAKGFIRIPDLLYNINFMYYPNKLIEGAFSAVISNHLFSREIFILAKKTSY